VIYPADVEHTSEPYLGLPPMAEHADHLERERVLLEALAWTLWHDTPQGADLVRHVEACAGELPGEARSILRSLQAEMDAAEEVGGPSGSGHLDAGKDQLPVEDRAA
jgi:hypothetical protein